MKLKELFVILQEKLKADPSVAAGLSAVFQLNSTGMGGEEYHIVFTDGVAQIHEGAAGNPNITISMDTGDFQDLVEGKLNALFAYMTGKLRVRGDMSLVMRLKALFQ